MAQKYKLIYCAVIDDEKHAGMIKIGDAEFVPTKPLDQYVPNESALEKAALARIKGWSGTAAAGARLLYCETLIRYNEKTQNNETYRDKEVHKVLIQAGFYPTTFELDTDSGTEWFPVELDTVKAAVKATKEITNKLESEKKPVKKTTAKKTTKKTTK